MDEFRELAASVKRDVMKLQHLYDPHKQPEVTLFLPNGTQIEVFDEIDVPPPPHLHAIQIDYLASQMNNLENFAERNGAQETQAFTTSAEETTDPTATTNYFGEVYHGTPESTLLAAPQIYILPDTQ